MNSRALHRRNGQIVVPVESVQVKGRLGSQGLGRDSRGDDIVPVLKEDMPEIKC